MPLDGITLQSVKQEMQALAGGRIDKISQPETDEIILAVRSGGRNYKLLLTARAQAPRVHFTSQTKRNPPDAPMFCMLLRKHLGGGRIIGVTQPDFERILEITIESPNEMGDVSAKRLIIEIMGKHSNIILVTAGGVILDALKHISPHTNIRAILPNREYTPPPGAKITPWPQSQEDFRARLALPDKQTLNLQQFLYQTYNGISPVMASEMVLCANLAPDRFVPSLSESEKPRLYEAFAALYGRITAGDFEYNIYREPNTPKSDFAPVPMRLYGHWQKSGPFLSPSAMLEEYYAGRDKTYRLTQKSADLRKLVAGLTERAAKLAAIHRKTQADIAGRDRLRLFGEVLTAYIYAVPHGQDSFSTQDFEGNDITIPLDTQLTPAQNAQAYFKKYNKEKRTAAALQEQIESNRAELEYLQTVAASIETVTTEEDIAEIRAELAGQGLLKKGAAARKQRSAPAVPLHFVTTDGFDIYVGKNNTQNDELTKKAHPADIWLHTKEIPGSHVILRTDGREPSEAALLEAANLAAYYSKAQKSGQVPVDYTLKKYVKKPGGAKPGFVIYTRQRTVYVTP